MSNYDANGKFILECDSGFQMVMGRARTMLELNKDLRITILGPHQTQCVTHPENIYPELFDNNHDRLQYVGIDIMPNALATRYDFNYEAIANTLSFYSWGNYDAVYINDPMHLRNFKALFYLHFKYTPKFYVHSHFIDDPSAPKFPVEASLWLGQCEAAIQADYNFWQCESSMNIFFEEFAKLYNPAVVEKVKNKSAPWDDGFSYEEITSEINLKNVRPEVLQLDEITLNGNKTVIFVPNRIGGKGRSSDYTNCGKFMFDILPQLEEHKHKFVIVAGNPSQKFSNKELEAECGRFGYVNISPDSFNRDEFKYVARRSDIVLGLYDADSYGGTASRECITLGAMPLWIDKYEYSTIAREAHYESYLIASDFSNFKEKFEKLLHQIRSQTWVRGKMALRDIIRERCSYEYTTVSAMQKMNLL